MNGSFADTPWAIVPLKVTLNPLMRLADPAAGRPGAVASRASLTVPSAK